MGENDNLIPADADWQYLEEMYQNSLKEDAVQAGPSAPGGDGSANEVQAEQPTQVQNGSLEPYAPVSARAEPAKASVGEVIDALGRELGLLKEQVGRVRGFDEIQRMYEELSVKVSRIEASGQYVDRVSEKVEAILAELDKRIPELIEMEEKTRLLQEMTAGIRKSVEKDEAVLKGAVYKDDFSRLAEDIERRARKFEEDAEDSARKLDEFGKSFLELEKKIELIADMGEKVSMMEAKLDRVAGIVLAADDGGLKDMAERVRRLEEMVGADLRASAFLKEQQPAEGEPALEKRLRELERSSRQTRDFLARDRGFAPEKRLQASILAEELHRLAAKVGILAEKGKLNEAKEAYMKIWAAYAKLNNSCDDRRLVEPLYKDIMHLRRIIYGEEASEQVVESRPVAPSSAEELKGSISRATALAEAGRVREAGAAYVRIVAQYSALKERDHKAAEVVYPYIDFLYKTIELKRSGLLK